MRNACLVAAAALVSIGVGWVFLPAGVICSGLLLGGFVLLTDE